MAGAEIALPPPIPIFNVITTNADGRRACVKCRLHASGLGDYNPIRRPFRCVPQLGKSLRFPEKIDFLLHTPGSMNPASSFVVWATWLSDHSLAVSIAIGLLAFAVEGLWPHRTKGSNAITLSKKKSSSGVSNPWVRTWLTNGLLLACAMVVSWLLAPWLSPWFSDALSGKTGLLVWLGFDSGASVSHVIIGIFLLDLMAYALHRVLHVVPIFWRLHQVHHSDTAMNASTHFRQHPLQLIITTALQLPLFWMLGIPGISWVLYAVLAAAVELWHHSSMRLSVAVQRLLGWIVVTPIFHRTHHNQERQFHDANYGAVFTIWDRLFGTATSAPLAAPLGLRRWKSLEAAGVIAFDVCMAMPFRPLITPAAYTSTRTVGKSAVRVEQKLRTNTRGKT